MTRWSTQGPEYVGWHWRVQGVLLVGRTLMGCTATQANRQFVGSSGTADAIARWQRRGIVHHLSASVNCRQRSQIRVYIAVWPVRIARLRSASRPYPPQLMRMMSY